MKNNLVIPLEAVRTSDADRVGYKAATLGTLLAAGFPVPPGLCITTEGFQLALAPRWRQIDTIIRQHNLNKPIVAREVAETLANLMTEILTGLLSETSSLKEIIADRKARYAEWLKLQPPPILGIPDAKLPERPPFKDEITPEVSNTSNCLVGQGASPGRYRGQAHVVSNISHLPKLLPGEILVAENVGPAWTPFFPILGGLILDEGILSQHAATTAREYGIPAVIQTKTATRRIPNGAWVIVDGTAGTIELEDRQTSSP